MSEQPFRAPHHSIAHPPTSPHPRDRDPDHAFKSHHIDGLCPECEQGKHDNCNGAAWDYSADDVTDCTCSLNGHRL